MSAELNADTPSVDTPEAIKPTGEFVLTDRLRKVAMGENPDAPEVESVEEVDDTELDSSTETPEVPATPEPVTWITAADRARAVSYGLDPEDLDAYENREQFGSALRAIDKAFSRRELPAQQQVAEAKSEQPEAEYVDQPVVNGKVNVEYWRRHKDEYEGGDVLLANAEHSAALEAKLASFEAKQAERDEALQQEQLQHFEAEFHRAVDAFRPDAFGKQTDDTGQLVPLKAEDIERRLKLLDACVLYTNSLHAEQQRAGLQTSTPPLSEVLKHAEFIAFPQEARERVRQEAIKEREAELKKIAKQAQRVRPVASTASTETAHRGTPHEDPGSTEAIMRNPKVKALLERIQTNAY